MRTVFGVFVLSLSAHASAAPLLIAHRGQSGTLPDHTLAAYERAVELGADYIEPDLVSTKDGVLVARHENEIGATTDVADKFPARKTTKTVDGERIEGWFTEDFTVAELKTLRARQPMKDRPHDQDGRHPIATFDEILDLRERLSKTHKREIGVYPETKHPTYFDGLGLSLEEPLLASLTSHGLTDSSAPVYIQSFEVGNLQELAKTSTLRRIQLVWTEGRPWDQQDGLSYGEMLQPEGLAKVRTWAHGIGVHKDQVIPRDAEDRLTDPTSLVADAHKATLEVHVYTFRSEDRYRPRDLSAVDEVRRYLDAGVDGVFCDYVDVGHAARTPK